MLADPSARQEDIDQARQALAEAVIRLQPKADKAILKETIEKAKAVDLSGCRQENINELQRALSKAEALMANEEISLYDQPLIDAAVLDLQKAMEVLQKEEAKASDPSKQGGDGGSGQNQGNLSSGQKRLTADPSKKAGRTAGVSAKAAKTGDLAPMIPEAVGLVLSLSAIALLLKKRRGNQKIRR